MNLIETIKKRKATREFSSNIAISKDKIYEMIKTAQLAPSAGNMQAYKVVPVTNQKIKHSLQKMCFNQKRDFIVESNLVFIVCADIAQSEKKYPKQAELYAVQDATIFASYLQLLAVDLGYATNWLGSIDEEKVKELLNISVKPVALIVIGENNDKFDRPKRRDFKDILIEESIT